MLQKFSSIKITFWGLIFLIASVLSGAFLTFNQFHAQSMKSLSRQLPLTWLINEARDDVILTVWFVTVCLLAGLFFIHTICCLLMRTCRLFQNRFSLRQWLFFLLHIMFVIVMLCHGLSMIIGYKHSDIELFTGQTHTFNGGYTLALSDVRFADDISILKAPFEDQRVLMTRENIHRGKNYAHIALLKNGRILSSAPIYMLVPLKYGSIQITLTDFFIPENRSDDTPGIKVVISNNPVIPYFFCAYALMIITFIGFIIITWRNDISRMGQPLKKNKYK